MEVPCEIDNIKTLKNGMKITLAVDDKNVKPVMKVIYNFMDRPLNVEFDINAEKMQERMEQISPEQRKKIYAIFRDIDSYTGQGEDSVKQQMKRMFVENTEYEMFSLSNCSKELASNFIEYLIRFCFHNGYPIKDNPKDVFDNVKRYIIICLKEKKCCICGNSYPDNPHHVETIGMGRDRRKVDDSENLVLPLCPEHHQEAHNIGDVEFCEKHHVEPVKRKESG